MIRIVVARTTFAVVLLAAVACGTSGDGAESQARFWTIQRLVEPSPTATFLEREHAVAILALDWSFGSDAKRWPRVTGSIESSWRGPGVRLEKIESQMVLEGEVDFDAAAVDEIEIETTRKSLWASVLYWAKRGEPLTKECSIRLSGADAATSTLRFSLVGHDCWQGRIGQLRFVLGSPGETIRVLAVRAVRRQIPAARARELAGSNWRLDLGGDVRDAKLAMPGMPWQARVEIPRDGRLAFAYTPGALADRVYDFQVAIELDEGGGAVLYRSQGEAGQTAATGLWNEAIVDLERFGGERGVLSFEVISTGDPAPSLRSLPAWGDVRLLAPRSTNAPDLVLVSLDTLRGDRVSISGHDRETTPKLDRWAGRSAIYYSRAVAPAPWTLPSHVSLFTGLDTISHGVDSDEGVPPGMKLLAERLRESGYRTVGVTGGGYLHPRYGLDRGFDAYIYWNRGQGSEVELEHNLGEVLHRLSAHEDEAIFFFFHTYEIHSPYHSRQPYFDRFGGESVPRELRRAEAKRVPLSAEEGYVVRSTFLPIEGGELPSGDGDSVVDLLYDSSIAYTDSKLSALLEQLELRRRRAPVLTVVTSDHGEALGERGLAAHAYPYEFNLHVPLFVAFPDHHGAGEIREDLVGLVDVAPTMLAAAGIDFGAADGVDLRGSPRGPGDQLWSYAGSTNWGVALRTVTDEKLILNDSAWEPVRGRREFFDLRKDSREQRDLSSASPDANRLERVARRRLGTELGGLVVTLRATKEEALRGRLASSMLHAQRAKLPDVRGQVRLEWRAPGALEFELAAGASARLVLLGQRLEAVELRAETGGRDWSRELDPKQLRSGVAFEGGDSGWRAVPLGSSRSVFELLWRGGADERPRPAPVDIQLEQQLRDLGYL